MREPIKSKIGYYYDEGLTIPVYMCIEAEVRQLEAENKKLKAERDELRKCVEEMYRFDYEPDVISKLYHELISRIEKEGESKHIEKSITKWPYLGGLKGENK